MTNKTTMPEPALVADRRVHGYVRFTAKGRLDFSRYPDGTKFITTDQAEAYAEARVREVQQWINVDDSLPPDDKTDLLAVHIDKEMEIVWGQLVCETYADGVYTHWMPLPPPPPK